LASFQSFARNGAASAPRRIRFEFNAKPVQVLGRDHVEAVRFERTLVAEGTLVGTGELFDISCGLVISAIGYRARPFANLSVAPSQDRLLNEEGRIEPGVYVAGWLRRGPSGKIGTNRADAEEIAGRIRSEVAPAGKPGFAALEKLLNNKARRWINFEEWKRIENAEQTAAAEGAPRLKFAHVNDMLAALTPT
jgi:NADPH-dependent glutamate synthase beta subunit-like oxidoreductase